MDVEISRIAELAGQRDGIVTRAEIDAVLTTPRAFEALDRAGLLHRQHRSVYAFGHDAVSPRGRLQAALLAAGGVLSHRTAATWWRLLHYDGEPELTTTARSGHDIPKLIVHRVRRAPQVTTHRGLPVTTVEQTLLDLATLNQPRTLARPLGEAEYLDIVNRDTLRALAAGRTGAQPIRAALGDQPAPTASDLEDRFLALIRKARLPPPKQNHDLHGRNVDFVWLQHRVIVETDGWAAHRRRTAFERDRHTDLELQAHGYRVARVTQRQLEREPLAVLVRVGALLLYSAASSHQ
jgi:very-short-patch-repair endonuclease